jgi:uncharacterized membrane protein
MNTYMVVLRIVHILAGVFWVGAALTTFLFLQPTAREVGPAAGPFMAHLAGKKRLVDWVLRAAGLTILAGLLMHWRDSGGLKGDWITSAQGLALTVGALCAITAFTLGLTIVKPTLMATLALGREVAASSGPPFPWGGVSPPPPPPPRPSRRRSSRRSASEGRTSGRSSSRC